MSAKIGSDNTQSKLNLDTTNVCFHIYSSDGKQAMQFLPAELDMIADTILFKSGSEFIVCKHYEKDGQHNIYIRQVNLGLGKNVDLWCDSRIEKSSYLKIHTWIRMHDIQDSCFAENIRIFHAPSTISCQYFNSKFFILSLMMCENYQFIQNMERGNENVI